MLIAAFTESVMAVQDHSEENHHEDRFILNAEQRREYGIEMGTAGKGILKTYIEVPGEVRINGDQMAHIVSRVPGVVVNVYKKLGDRVAKGDILAEIDSRELAGAKALYLAAVERQALAQSIFERESRLWDMKITSEQEYLDARKNVAEAGIELQTAKQSLFALGFPASYLKNLPGLSGASFTRFTITAPFSGTIIKKHITRGEVLREETETFTLANLETVWVDLQVYQKDLSAVKEGQRVRISTQSHSRTARSRISFLSPVVDEITRTVLARIVLPNPDRTWRPGLFVAGEIIGGTDPVAVCVPLQAIQSDRIGKIVFVYENGGFELNRVVTGRSDGEVIEIIGGLKAGETIVVKGAFSLKAELEKSELDSGHSH
jgi:cobalt-zinc-cadmium efflux system membrane fusion protein